MPLSVQQIVGRLTFRQLQVFKAVHDLKSYSKAGELLGLTQPAVSSQIRQLEQALGAPLFEYVGRRLFCTAAGEHLYRSIELIFGTLASLQTELGKLKGQVVGELRLAAVNTAQYVVPHLLRAFLDLYPEIKVNVVVVNRATALQRLENNSDDLVIMAMVPPDRALSTLPFLDNELVPVVPAGHPLSRMPSVTAQAFFQSQYLSREPGSGTRLAVEQHCQSLRVPFVPSMELGSNDAVKHAVLAGLGVAVLPRLSIISELRLNQLCIPEVKGFPLKRSWCVVHPKAKHLTPAMRAFIDYIAENIGRFEPLFMRRFSGA